MKFMKRNWMTLIGLFALIVVFGCAGMESYKLGEQLSKSNRWDEAVVYYEKAVKENPQSKQYQQKLTLAKQKAAKVHYKRAKQELSSTPELNLLSLDQILKEARRAYDLDSQNKTISAFYNTLNEKRKKLIFEIKALYHDADSDMVEGKWMDAVTKLRRINEIFPGYEDTGDKLAKAEEQGFKFSYKQGILFGKQEDWKMASRSFKAAMDINPDFLDVEKLYEDARSKDNIKYFIKGGNEALRKNNWEQALIFYEKALEYQPDNKALLKKVESLKIKVGKSYFDQAVKLTQQGKLYQACKKIELARMYYPSIQDRLLFNKLINNLSQKLVQRAEKYSKQKKWGNALVWLQKVEVLNPNYQDIFYKTLEARDAITKRIKKSIAVFDFGSPSNYKDAGKIVSNKLIAFLHTNASGDVKIIERENLKSLLKEVQLGQTGLVDRETVRTAKMKGIDTFILGDVLQYSVKTDTHMSSNQAKVLIDTEMVPNPDFMLWLMQHRTPTQEDWKHAPPKEREKKNYQLVSYKTGVNKISSLIEISYKLVDTKTGENLSTDTVSGKLVKEDKYRDEVPMANISYDPLDLPSELEVLDELSNAKVSEFGRRVLKHFQSLEVEYFNEAYVQLKRRRYEDAIERYMDALFDEKLKRISTPISQQSLDMIDKLTQNR